MVGPVSLLAPCYSPPGDNAQSLVHEELKLQHGWYEKSIDLLRASLGFLH